MISVIITTFNSQDYIERSLISVLNQTKFDLINEIILVDDDSTDDTINIAKKIYNNLIVLKKKNSGPASSRNIGVKRANSKFICFLDADDFWHKDKIKLQTESYKKNKKFDIFVCNTISVFGKKYLNVRYDKTKIFGNDKIIEGQVNSYIKAEGRYSFHPPSSIMVKKKIFLKFGYFDENLKYISVEDSEIFLRWVLNNCKIYFDSTPLIFYETNNQNSLTKKNNQWIENHFQYWKEIDILKIKKNEKKKFIKMRRNTLLGSLFTLIKRNENYLARKFLLKNFKILNSTKFYVILIISFLPISSLKKLIILIKKKYDHIIPTKN